ncbi:hypothetical protein AAFF_G00019890 [Aldrovandia affinis]|uniref:Uncharacterized protein n=1 Tax=Aldrovandia affinis TaxID=143900 RepID=A0AAD7S619_9TELE|nr:hypothetical protein AAFF_G00019890 [Aldrovandia affinis]
MQNALCVVRQLGPGKRCDVTPSLRSAMHQLTSTSALARTNTVPGPYWLQLSSALPRRLQLTHWPGRCLHRFCSIGPTSLPRTTSSVT